MSEILKTYKSASAPLPPFNLSWPLYGAGFESLGSGGRPVAMALPPVGSHELLLRVDAVGLCFSDIKLTMQGAEHPRIHGRNLKENPAVPGHEASLTVVGVGSELAGRFKVGERYLIQADVFYQGASIAFGYVLPGALQQFVKVGREILEGDEGCYLIPVRTGDGYAEVALSEPWACVIASYGAAYREHLRPSGTALFVGAGDRNPDDYEIEGAFSPEGAPAKIIHAGLGQGLLDRLAAAAGGRTELIAGGDDYADLARIPSQASSAGFDDIVVFGRPSAGMAEALGRNLAKGGVLAILADTPLERKVGIDVGRIHYDHLHFVGTRTRSLADAYRAARSVDLKPGGRAWMVGAGGPMGQMHTQRAAGLPKGPSAILATDVDNARLRQVADRFGDLAAKRGAVLATVNPAAVPAFEEEVEARCGQGFFDDIVVLAPVPSLIEQADTWLADDGVLNIFAGVPRGTMASLDISGTYLHGHRWTGNSGSSLADLRNTLTQTQRGELAPNESVAAIGGVKAALEGLKAVKGGRFAGKIVIWPQFPDLPLMSLEELAGRLPEVAAKLSASGRWTKEAEEALIETQYGKLQMG